MDAKFVGADPNSVSVAESSGAVDLLTVEPSAVAAAEITKVVASAAQLNLRVLPADVAIFHERLAQAAEIGVPAQRHPLPIQSKDLSEGSPADQFQIGHGLLILWVPPSVAGTKKQWLRAVAMLK